MKTRDKMPMKDIFINNFIPSGLVLLAVIGPPQIAAALLTLQTAPQGPLCRPCLRNTPNAVYRSGVVGLGTQYPEQYLFHPWPSRSGNCHDNHHQKK